MLTATLKDLELKGIVHREQFNEIPPHVEYSFTEKGRDLYPIFYAMMNWGYKYEKDFYGEKWPNNIVKPPTERNALSAVAVF